MSNKKFQKDRMSNGKNVERKSVERTQYQIPECRNFEFTKCQKDRMSNELIVDFFPIHQFVILTFRHSIFALEPKERHRRVTLVELSKGRWDEEIWRLIKTGNEVGFKIEIAFRSSSVFAMKNRFSQGRHFESTIQSLIAPAHQHYLHDTNMGKMDCRLFHKTILHRQSEISPELVTLCFRHLICCRHSKPLVSRTLKNLISWCERALGACLSANSWRFD